MGNVLEFYLKMKDMMSSGIAKAASVAKTSFKQIEGYINNATSANKKFGDSFDNVDRKIKSTSSSLGGWVRNIGIAAAATAALSFGTGSVKAAMDFGATKESFKVLTGSDKTGNAMAGDLNKLQQDTILGPEVFKSAQTMLGFGIAADKVMPTIKMLGDVSMGNADKMSSLTLAFSQVQAAGRLTGQDLLQFINAGFNPLNEISKQTGLSIGELKKKMEGGAISADMVTKAFEAATGKGGLFNGMMAKLADTPFGKLKQLEGQFEALKIKVGETLMPVAELFMKLAGFMMEHIEIVLVIAGAWASYTAITKAAAVAQGVLNAIMAINPIILIIAAIIALIGWIIYMVKTNKAWGDSLKAIWEMIKAFGALAWIPFKAFAENSWYYVEKLWLQVKDFAQSVVAIFGNIKKAWDMAWSGNFAGAKDALFADLNTGASKELDALEARHKAMQGGYRTEMLAAQKSFTDNAKLVDFSKKTGSAKVGAGSVGAAGGGGTGMAGMMGGGGKADKAAASVTGGGPRNITISGVTMKLADHVTVAAANADDLMNQMEDKLGSMFLRVLNSGSAVQN